MPYILLTFLFYVNFVTTTYSRLGRQTGPNSNLFICSINSVNLSTDQILTYQRSSGCRSL